MKHLFLILTCIALTLLLTGCLGGGGGGSSGSSGGSFDVAGLLGGDSDGGGIFSGGGGVFEHTPEPATVALLGGGLAVYAFLKRKKK